MNDGGDGFRHWRIESAGEYCALILDRQGRSANTLDAEVIDELDRALNIVEERGCHGLLIGSGKTGGFIAGADIGSFVGIDSVRAEALISRAHQVFDRLERLDMPTVAEINGHCLGGGLELALACRYRVALEQPSVRIGLPEVKLGIHPGFGGSVRLIEAIGVPGAMQLMLAGRVVAPGKAKRLGIVDLSVPGRQLRRAAMHLLRTQLPRRQARSWRKALALGPVRPLVARTLHKQVAARVNAAHYPAPFTLIDLWREHGGDRRRMLREEGKSVARLIGTPTAQNLVRVFFLQERLKRLGGGAAGNPDVQHVHVVGAGVMGGDIAAWCALGGLRVTLQDASQESIARAVKRAHGLFVTKLRDPRRVQAAMDRLQPDPAGSGACSADLAIEAIYEDLAAKQALFAQIESEARPETLLATNTSSIPLEAIGESLADPSRLVGLHFFNPVAKMQLVEVVQGADTPAETANRAAAFVGRIGRLPVPVKSAPGFLVNRVLMPYLLEAVQLLEEGVPGPLIDQAATRFGMPMGPVELADSVGLDICHHVAENLTRSFGGDAPALLQQKVD
ncbi:MAG: 3-hydroxyacyl-CoA dehydrogenase NAD-binding domain-containing protein, partial [Pseudomonadota bacterium]|nr:3-hydroxyacyl-CoA dehydrogenase NAD-binding domain-containing protein [Pseudomonadota bacterium]